MSHRLQIVVLPDLIWLSGFGAAAQTVTAREKVTDLDPSSTTMVRV
jgi:hypothetical protein